MKWMALFAAALAAMAAMAQERPDSVKVLPEVSVTAVKGAGAVARTTVTQGEMQQLGVVTMKGVSELAPNLYIPDYGSRMTSSIYMRGIGARIDQPAVGLTIDNVPVLNKDNYDFDLVDVDRIEVLRGPQSALYGRNTMAGQIAVTTLSPMKWRGIRLMAEGSTGWGARAAVSWLGAVGTRAAMAVGASVSHTDGYWRNSYDGCRVGRDDCAQLRWKTVWTPGRRFMLENTASASVDRQRGYPYRSAATGEISYNDPCNYRRLSVADGLTWRLGVGAVDLTGIASVQYLDDEMNLDQDFTPQPYFTLKQKRRETAVTHDLVARGRAGDYSWLAGAYAFYKNSSMSAPVTFKDYGIQTLIVDHANAINDTYPIVWTDDSFELGSDFDNRVWGVSAYHRSTLSLGKFTAEADLRLDYEHNRLDWHSRCDTSYDILDLTDPATPTLYGTCPVSIDDDGRLARSFTRLLPRLALSYRPGGAVSEVYASVARGYKAGGFNTQMFSDVLQQRLMSLMGLTMKYDADEIVSYRPEQSWNYEAGIKLASAAPGRWSAEAALFWIDCRDQQVTMFPDGTTTGRVMANAGRSRSRGVEISGHWRPAARWQLRAAWGWCDARFTEFRDGINDYSGNRVPYAPRNTLLVSAGYTLPLPGGSALTLAVDCRGAGSIVWDEAGEYRQPFYALLGASATWQLPSGLSFRLWGENLTDTRYSTFRFVSIGHTFTQQGRPVRAGVTLRYELAFGK